MIDDSGWTAREVVYIRECEELMGVLLYAGR
jgi:hypothetical protein